jgi:hypothetical protein
MALVKREKILLGVCGVVVVGAMLYQFVIYPASQEKTSPKPENSKPQTVSIPATNTQLAAPPSPVQNTVTPLKQYDSWGRDPFTYSKTLNAAPSTSVSVRKEKHKLRGILWKQGKAFVVIDDKVLAEGEEENGLKVERINKTAAVCREGGRTFTLELTEKP